MNIRVVGYDDIDTLFELRTSVVENYQSREEIAELGITPQSISQMLDTDCCAWIAEIGDRAIGFSIANATEKTIFGIFVRPAFEDRGAWRALMQAAESWLFSKGIEEIWLVTGNDATVLRWQNYKRANAESIVISTCICICRLFNEKR